MRVLVIEDDSSVRETLGMVLEAYQHHPDLVESGEEALERLKKVWPDVMLLDLTLQGGSGEEAFERIRLEFGRVPPTVVLSAAQQGAARARRMPGAYFLAKPYTIEQLEDVLCEAANSSRNAA
ncbi:response regulator [Bdellovibrionota bacterium FG-1]